MFLTLVEVAPGEAHLIDSTTSKAHRSAVGGKGEQAQSIMRSRAGRTTKIHAVVDGRSRPLNFEVTPGQLGDVRAAPALLGPLPPAAVCALRSHNPPCGHHYMLDLIEPGA